MHCTSNYLPHFGVIYIEPAIQMDSLQCARASRHGGFSFVTKLLAKAQKITKANVETAPQLISAADRAEIVLVFSQPVLHERMQLEELDQAIASANCFSTIG